MAVMKKTWMSECRVLLGALSNTGREEWSLPNWLTPQTCSFCFPVEAAAIEAKRYEGNIEISRGGWLCILLPWPRPEQRASEDWIKENSKRPKRIHLVAPSTKKRFISSHPLPLLLFSAYQVSWIHPLT